MTGGSGAGGSFKVGDTVTLKFQLFDNATPPQPVTDLSTNSAWAGTFLVAGPTSNPQRVFGTAGGGVNMKTSGALTYDATSQTYTYVRGRHLAGELAAAHQQQRCRDAGQPERQLHGLVLLGEDDQRRA